MAKGSGSTRTQRPAPNNIFGQGVSASQYEALVNSISKDGQIDIRVWEDLTNSQRELALMEAGFSGMIGEDFSDGTLYIEENRESLLSRLNDAILNDANFGPDADNTWTIGYKDGTRKYLDGTQNDFDVSGQLTNRQSGRTQSAIAEKAINKKNIAYILSTSAIDQPRYYVNGESGQRLLKDYGGFEFWKKGRGEKRRDYIQDDWI